MGDEPLAKAFKSGNSKAIRIPATVELEVGSRWKARYNEAGELVLTPVAAKPDRLDMSFVGKGCGLRPFTREERIIHPRPSDVGPFQPDE